MKFGLCVIGCGAFAHTFAGSVASLRDELDLYFASRDRDRAQAYAREFGGAGTFGSYEAAAADPGVDALYVCTPHHLHLEHTRLAARAGKHVLLEKPIARTIQEGREIVSLARAAGVTLMVAENYRFLAAVREAKSLIQGGTLGDLRLIQLQEEYPFEPASWRSSKEHNGGGVFIDGGIHKASVLAYLAGRPNQVFAMEVPPSRPGLAAEDGIVVMTRAPGGVVGVINHTWSVGQPTERPWVSISGTKGSLYFELGRPWLRLDRGSAQETRQLDQGYRT